VSYDGELCEDCDQPYSDTVWFAEDDSLWPEVTAWPLRHGTDPGPGLLCPACFSRRAKAKGIKLRWNPARVVSA
jgi:hypothetical protein